jgi:hypothetical protein
MTPLQHKTVADIELRAWVRYHQQDYDSGLIDMSKHPPIFRVVWLSSEGPAAVEDRSLRAALEIAMLLDPVGGEPSEHLGAWLVPPRWG